MSLILSALVLAMQTAKAQNVSSVFPSHESATSVTSNPELKGKVDICIPLIRFSALLKNYKNVSIRTNTHVLQQIYYDAVMSGCNVTIDSSNTHCNGRMKELISQLNKGTESIRDTILREHLSQHRAEKLLSLCSTVTTERYFTV